ncbi:hypothetical protein B0H21DRAFT_718654 [Amylocystis lapponica]|nr:hypothetical protein B0H21DRAFT_718654 [Amylocystis lapponica]
MTPRCTSLCCVFLLLPQSCSRRRAWTGKSQPVPDGKNLPRVTYHKRSQYTATALSTNIRITSNASHWVIVASCAGEETCVRRSWVQMRRFF